MDPNSDLLCIGTGSLRQMLQVKRVVKLSRCDNDSSNNWTITSAVATTFLGNGVKITVQPMNARELRPQPLAQQNGEGVQKGLLDNGLFGGVAAGMVL
eukprot:gene4832-biopygen2945